jgi:sulfate adenylyltransferase
MCDLVKHLNTYNILLSDRILCDLKCLLDGSFAPLKGFMNKEEYNNVINYMTLKDGSVWTMPIVLPVIVPNTVDIEKQSRDYSAFRLYDQYGNYVACVGNSLYGYNNVWIPDLIHECQQVYGSTETNHPYVAEIHRWLDKADKIGGQVWYIGGVVTDKGINKSPLFINFPELRNSPKDLEEKCAKYENVVGFQTRNPMHYCHIELTKSCLQTLPDNHSKLLLIQPIVGVTQECDVEYTARVKCYKHILNEYNKDVVLSLLPLSMRMAGPREAVWHALIRRNYGCTHFIIGRDHAGPSSCRENGEPFYKPYDAQELAQSLDLGITIITSPMIMYDDTSQTYVTEDKVTSDMTLERISGTELRRRLQTGEDVPEWFSPPRVIEELRKTYNRKGLCIYIVGLSASGKSTLALYLKQIIQEKYTQAITILDGDIVRKNLSKGLGFSKEDRSTNVRRIGYVAYEIVKHGGIVLCANIAPYEADRAFNRSLISSVGQYVEVFMDTPLEVCEKRDPKKLYEAARNGVIKNFTGISDPFEEPLSPEFTFSAEKDASMDIAHTLIDTLHI